MTCLRLPLLLIFLILHIPTQSNAFSVKNMVKLAHADLDSTATYQVSPSPSPVSAEILNSGDGPSSVNLFDAETSDMVFDKIADQISPSPSPLPGAKLSSGSAPSPADPSEAEKSRTPSDKTVNQMSPSPSPLPAANLTSRNAPSSATPSEAEINGVVSNKTAHQMSSSPSPAPVKNLGSRNSQSPADPSTTDSCYMVFHRCDVMDYDITACVPFVGNGSQASYVLVQNYADNYRQVNITVLPANNFTEDILISGHHFEKVNLPSDTGRNSTIFLKVENKDCTIHLGISAPQDLYTRYLTPVNGAYLFFISAVFIGGTWACCKLGKRDRHLDGVPYMELEMKQADSEPDPAFSIGTPEGWDLEWDDDWDEEKATRSPGVNRTAKKLENGASSKDIDNTEWRNDWDD